MPIDRSSKLRTGGSSREPPAAAVRERGEDLGSSPDEWTLCAVAGRLLPEINRLERVSCCSGGSAEDPGRLLEAMPLFEALPGRKEDPQVLSESTT